MAYTVSVFGSGALANLGLLMVTFWAIARSSACSGSSPGSAARIVRFVRLLRDELLIIVGTSSSETVLPRLLAKLEAAGASRQSVGMVIPTGYSFNLDGTCIYLTLGALFIVQAPGQDMALGEQLALAALMIITSKGAAGMTGAGLVTLTASLQAFGGEFFSAEAIAVGIALVVGIDRIMSEGRALTNCIGNGVATMVIAKCWGTRRRAVPTGAAQPVARGRGDRARAARRRGARGPRRPPAKLMRSAVSAAASGFERDREPELAVPRR